MGGGGLKPVKFRRRNERSAARAAIDVGIVDSGRHFSVTLQFLRGAGHAFAGDGDHAVARRQMLERAVDDLAHALDRSLVLTADALDAAVAGVALHLAV